MRRALAWGLLLAQLASVAWHRGREEKYFCWAPYDQQTRFTVRATVAGRTLTPREVQDRYGFAPNMLVGDAFWDQRAWGNPIGLIRRRESALPPGEAAEVVVRYSVNGRPEREWTWP